ncbi:MAG TPA: MgtC/SapB family protein [Paracoccus sp. (in: a-proteobacteria)]|nr:MgtC/SapB family protein [Paracoccus sp. (in: a-proteobacteria)]
MDLWQEVTSGLDSVSLTTAVVRLAAALLLGGVIGLDREAAERPAGLRTHMLIALASATFAIVAMELTSIPSAPSTRLQADPLRLMEAVTSGVAFLAAGSIVINGGSVRGVTTGASMWLCGAIGLCCGTGDIKLALLVTFLAMIVLVLLRLIVPESGNDQPAGSNDRDGD